jgi:hypothetical protein
LCQGHAPRFTAAPPRFTLTQPKLEPALKRLSRIRCPLVPMFLLSHEGGLSRLIYSNLVGIEGAGRKAPNREYAPKMAIVYNSQVYEYRDRNRSRRLVGSAPFRFAISASCA